MCVSSHFAGSSVLSLPVLALAGVLSLSLNSAAAQDTRADALLKEVKVQATQDVQALPAAAAGGQVARWPRAAAWGCWATAM